MRFALAAGKPRDDLGHAHVVEQCLCAVVGHQRESAAEQGRVGVHGVNHRLPVQNHLHAIADQVELNVVPLRRVQLEGSLGQCDPFCWFVAHAFRQHGPVGKNVHRVRGLPPHAGRATAPARE